VRGCRVSAGTKRPLTKARVPGRPKGGAFLAVGYPGVFHVPLRSRRGILTEVVSTITTIDLPAVPGQPAVGLTPMAANV
jgi:hypothetical protein